MLKKLTPPREYAAPSVDVLEIVSEQEMFTGSNAEGMYEEDINDLFM